MTAAMQTMELGGGWHMGPVAGMEIISDSTLCLMPHRLPRRCPACGTVFHGSVISPVASGPNTACPYCLDAHTVPLVPQ